MKRTMGVNMWICLNMGTNVKMAGVGNMRVGKLERVVNMGWARI